VDNLRIRRFAGHMVKSYTLDATRGTWRSYAPTKN
jgi:hypothetical protein